MVPTDFFTHLLYQNCVGERLLPPLRQRDGGMLRVATLEVSMPSSDCMKFYGGYEKSPESLRVAIFCVTMMSPVFLLMFL